MLLKYTSNEYNEIVEKISEWVEGYEVRMGKIFKNNQQIGEIKKIGRNYTLYLYLTL
jgi:hypothetical protein